MASCNARSLDAGKFTRYFLSNGFVINKNPRNADYILFISCAYKKNIEDLSISRIRKLSRYKGKLIVGGCLKGINEQRLKEYFKGESFVTSNNEYIDKIFPDFKLKFNNVIDAHIPYPELLLQKYKRVLRSKFNITLSPTFLKRIMIFLREKSFFFKPYYIRICWGCIESHCTYCRIWYATGKLRSKPTEACVEELRNGVRKKFKTIILTGDNIGAYGLDMQKTFPDLLYKLVEVTGKYELRLDYLNPMWIVKYINDLKVLFKTGRIRTVNCPIQSGSNRILALMNRGHNISQLREALNELKIVCPALKLYTHIIIGFPSETEEDFENTITFVKQNGFESVQIFPFCKNADMSKECLRNEIAPHAIQERIGKAIAYFRKNGIACLVD